MLGRARSDTHKISVALCGPFDSTFIYLYVHSLSMCVCATLNVCETRTVGLAALIAAHEHDHCVSGNVCASPQTAEGEEREE